ncbi:peptide/nickel transport system permease protein [Melghirimyces profundicolus]|uniref:Peptide/nickel transport system permease protein n=1 Tax=Melghirimyces profundicolus TaxID=1242148 RepID=A0A2T6C7H4_9BACL|nr:ABC transporter permease [Melghirimyces profundicolus]PTX64281.1 peptide/nickel transport system permease protein [Melghirimyces profundicolus]
MNILNYILIRFLWAIPTLLGVSILVFLMIHLIPGDPAQLMLYPRGTPEQVEALREQLGLNDPMAVQYFNWLKDALFFDFGKSVSTGSSVISEISSRFAATVELALSALSIAVVVGIPLGVIAARKKNSLIDYLCITFSLGGVSIPVFWLGLMLIFVFAATLGWLPVSGRISMDSGMQIVTGFYLLDALLIGNLYAFGDAVKHLILPAVALSTIPLAMVVRITRSSMLEVLSQDYMKTARAKGIPGRLIIYKHALRNALIPVVTVLGIQIGSLMGGSILTETVFSWPGLGSLIIDSINDRDYPVIQGVVFLATLIMIVVNLIVDVLYAYLDPRIRY